jgi:hypothetical protein
MGFYPSWPVARPEHANGRWLIGHSRVDVDLLTRHLRKHADTCLAGLLSAADGAPAADEVPGGAG